jgi:hypothetical protein
MDLKLKRCKIFKISYILYIMNRKALRFISLFKELYVNEFQENLPFNVLIDAFLIKKGKY